MLDAVVAARVYDAVTVVALWWLRQRGSGGAIVVSTAVAAR
jgi:hypothetical protein